jgi:hypothetical protein
MSPHTKTFLISSAVCAAPIVLFVALLRDFDLGPLAIPAIEFCSYVSLGCFIASIFCGAVDCFYEIEA